MFVTCVRHRHHFHRLLQRRYLSDDRVLTHICAINISVALSIFTLLSLFWNEKKNVGHYFLSNPRTFLYMVIQNTFNIFHFISHTYICTIAHLNYKAWVPNSLNSVIASGNLLSASSWVCWRTQPWYHLAEIYTDPSGCGKKENLSSLHRLVMRTPLYLIQRSLIEDLKCIAHVKILTSKLQLKTTSKHVHKIIHKTPFSTEMPHIFMQQMKI